jgi:hypothetical protein
MENRIEEWSKRIGKKPEDFKKEIDETVEKIKKQRPDLKDDEIRAEVLKQMFLKHRAELRTPAIEYEGFIIGDTGVEDIVERRRKVALEMVSRNPEQAILLKLVNEKLQPLSKAGRVLPEHLYTRRLFGFCKTRDEPTYKLFVLVLRDKCPAFKNVIPMFTPLMFRANINRNQPIDGWLNLTSSITTNFAPVVGKMENIVDLMIKSPIYVPLEKVEQYHQANSTMFWRRHIITNGSISNINTFTKKDGSQGTLISLWNENIENDIAGFYSGIVNCDIGDDVIIFGRTSTRTKIPPSVVNVSKVNLNILGILTKEKKVKFDEEVVELV